MSKRQILGPFSRVEGDLEVQIERHHNRVADAWVVSPLYRGFERMLVGKEPQDALVYVPRICGICSVAQSAAAAQALAQAAGVRPPENGRLASQLMLAAENVADHLTHFYLFFMPDFARPIYAGQPWYEGVLKRFKAVDGAASRVALPARASFLHLMGILGGRWPHTLALQPGGSTRGLEARDKSQLRGVVAGFRAFLEETLFGASLESLVALESGQSLLAWAAEQPCQNSDFRWFLQVAETLELAQLGRGHDGFMSYGAYGQGEEALFAAGVWQQGGLRALDPGAIREDVSHAWMHPDREPRHPFEGRTLPDAEQPNGYSWCKAPRLNGLPMEVGALARQQVAGHPLVRDLVAQSGGNVRNRVIARLLEIARVVLAMEGWIAQLEPRAPFGVESPLPEQGQGVGLVEAARGGLGHWYRMDKGRLSHAQIVAPTTWNFSPRDAAGVRGPLEQALLNSPIRAGEQDPVAVQHIVRSFDPCMVCTVH
ncbi:nickel-dependent hydrogenase, large subunit [Magnetococcus marinus MC-1]|uniref:Nickel-dependent hydrogenase, large subunit n=1 Tax=Magnetococcus marinus (strain ATCC BAA-1437 / JCM 17883 / MC-1) TaxID=156889 RepID=A0LAK0_MAGMM|nr:nickel-dependent hydrogenase large subunit [Magnetococcus marinus]ABK44993.1 nickel-dependent hydrogenase, large subunit [Magnetococcus marinus MC-1]